MRAVDAVDAAGGSSYGDAAVGASTAEAMEEEVEEEVEDDVPQAVSPLRVGRCDELETLLRAVRARRAAREVSALLEFYNVRLRHITSAARNASNKRTYRALRQMR